MSNIPNMDNIIRFDCESMFVERTITGNIFEKWIKSGPCDGLLKRFLDALVDEHDKMWSSQRVKAWSTSSHTQRIYGDGFTSIHRPLKLNSCDNESYVTFNQLASRYPRDNLLDITHFCEAWGVLHFGLLASHYGFGNAFATMEYTGLLLSARFIALNVMGSNSLAPEVLVACKVLTSAIVKGLDQAQYTTSLAANASDVTLHGSSLDGPCKSLELRAPNLDRSVIDSNPLSWAIHFASNHHGNIAIPDTNTEAKVICAIAHLMEVPIVLAHKRKDLEQPRTNFIIANNFD